MPDSPESTPQTADVKAMATHWLLGQPATTVLLFIIVLGGGWFGKYIIDTAVPKHLEQIQQGYEKVQQEGMRESKAARQEGIRETAAAREESLETRKTFEKTLDRFERMTQRVCTPSQVQPRPQGEGK